MNDGAVFSSLMKMEQSADFDNAENAKERKRGRLSCSEKVGKKAMQTPKFDEELSDDAADEVETPNKSTDFDDALVQNNVFTAILNEKKMELLESEAIISALNPLKTEND